MSDDETELRMLRDLYVEIQAQSRSGWLSPAQVARTARAIRDTPEFAEPLRRQLHDEPRAGNAMAIGALDL
jgi:hypothetical protein